MPPLPEHPPIQALNTILLWPFSLQSQGNLYSLRANDKKAPSEWLRGYSDYISQNSNNAWKRVSNPLTEYFGVAHLYRPEQQYAELVYFHQFFRKLLYETDDRRRAIEILTRDDIASLRLTISQKDLATEITLAVHRIQLFLTASDLAILAIELECPIDASVDFALACDILNQVRRVYVPYFKLADPATPTPDCPRRAQFLAKDGSPVGPLTDFFAPAGTTIEAVHTTGNLPLAPHWAAILQPLEPWAEISSGEAAATGGSEEKAARDRPSRLCFEQLGDERAYVMARVVLRDPHSLPPAQQYRLAYLDSSGQGYAYNRAFLKTQDPAIFYDRFWSTHAEDSWMSTRIISTSYSFIMLTSDYQLDEPGGLGPMLLGHFRHHYFLLNLIAIMQRGSLLIFWDRLANLLRTYSTEGDNRQEFHANQRWLSEDFANYWARFEFSEASNQIQPLELFDMIRKNFRVEQLSGEVARQLQFTRDIEESHYQEGLTLIANLWIPVSLALSFLGVSLGIKEFWDWSIDSQMKGLRWDLVGKFAALASAAVVASGLVFYFVNRTVRRNRPLRHLD